MADGPRDSSPILDWEESAQRQAETPQDAAGAWGEWLGTNWDWDVFATLTFADPKDQGTHTAIGWSLSDRLFREWADRMTQRAGWATNPYWVRAREPHKHRTSTHFHALIGGVGNLSRREMWEDWFRRNGQARIEPVNSHGATFYVAKYINKTGGDITFSENAGLYGKGSLTDEQRDNGDCPASWRQGHG